MQTTPSHLAHFDAPARTNTRKSAPGDALLPLVTFLSVLGTFAAVLVLAYTTR